MGEFLKQESIFDLNVEFICCFELIFAKYFP